MIRLIALATFLISLGAWAQESADESTRKQQAKELRNVGVEASERGDYLVALEKFEQAHKLYPSPALVFNQARVLADLGRDLEALEHFERFVAEAKDPPPEFQSVAKAKIAILSQRIARLEIACETPSAQVSLDGKTIGTAPLHTNVRVLPGTHEVSARAEGYSPSLSAVIAQPGRQDRVDLILLRPPVPRPLHKKWWFWTALGGGAAVLAATVAITAIYAQPKFPDANYRATPGSAFP